MVVHSDNATEPYGSLRNRNPDHPASMGAAGPTKIIAAAKAPPNIAVPDTLRANQQCLLAI